MGAESMPEDGGALSASSGLHGQVKNLMLGMDCKPQNTCELLMMQMN